MARQVHDFYTSGNNNDVIFTPPTGVNYQILGVFYHLATSSTVGNRLIEIYINDGLNNQIWNTRSAYDQAASSDQFGSGVPGGSQVVNQNRQFVEQPLPNPCFLYGNWSLEVKDRANIDSAGDTLTVAVHYMQLDRF